MLALWIQEAKGRAQTDADGIVFIGMAREEIKRTRQEVLRLIALLEKVDAGLHELRESYVHPSVPTFEDLV